jgi:hypothetical protein
MGRIAPLVLALLVVASAAPASAQGREMHELREVAEQAVAQGQHWPVVELLTMGVGSLIWERHGHIALCVAYEDPSQDACYNYGVADFQHPIGMAAGFFRGTHSFWVDKMAPENMLWVYLHFDRTVWVQPLPLDDAQKIQVIGKLEHDILIDNRYYAYDHFWDNCTTRVRDIIDNATNHALSTMKEPSDGKTYRDLAREGFYGIGHYVPLIITDLAMGRVTDRVPSYYERMFLPDYLREAVAKKWGVQPTTIYVRSECRGSTAPGCAERGAPYQPDSSGRIWFILIALVLTAPAWATRLWGRFSRAGMAVAVIPYAFLGFVFWFLAIISPLPYVRWNESCLVFLPADILLVWWLTPERRRTYARFRVGMLAVVAALLVVGVLKQPIWYALVWPLVPNAVAAFWPSKPE